MFFAGMYEAFFYSPEGAPSLIFIIYKRFCYSQVLISFIIFLLPL